MTRLLLAVAVLALIATGCGAAENDPNLAQAAAMTEDAGSSRFALWGKQTDRSEPSEITCSGEANYDAKSVRLRCEYASETLELIAIGNESYLRGDLFGSRAGANKWLKLTDDESLGRELSPRRLLAMLRGASQSTERVGEEEVRGVDTVRYRLVVDCEEAEVTDCEGTTADVDVWIGQDGLVRRVAVEEGSSPSTFEFFDFGVAVDVQPPPPGEVQEIDTLFGSAACRPGFGSPIALEQATNALRRHGFTIAGEVACSTESASLENDPAARADEGHVYCVVRATAPEGAPTRVQPLGSGVASMALRLQNVECTLVADGGAEAKLRRLRAALTELER